MSDEVPGLFGVGVTSLGRWAEQYRTWFKHRNEDGRRKVKLPMPSMVYVAVFKPNVKQADIWLIETVATYLAVRNQIPPTSVAIVSDGPLLLSEIPNLIQLDGSRNAWHFRLHPIDYAAFEVQRLAAAKNTDPNIWAETTPIALDRLGLVIDETASGTLLTPINGLSNQLNFQDRIHFRQFLARYLAGAINLAGFETSMRKLLEASQGEATQVALLNLNRVVGMLKKNGTIYKQAVESTIDKKSANRFIKDTAITPFEVRWLTRLVLQHQPKLEKTG